MEPLQIWFAPQVSWDPLESGVLTEAFACGTLLFSLGYLLRFGGTEPHTQSQSWITHSSGQVKMVGTRWGRCPCCWEADLCPRYEDENMFWGLLGASMAVWLGIRTYDHVHTLKGRPVHHQKILQRDQSLKYMGKKCCNFSPLKSLSEIQTHLAKGAKDIMPEVASVKLYLVWKTFSTKQWIISNLERTSLESPKRSCQPVHSPAWPQPWLDMEGGGVRLVDAERIILLLLSRPVPTLGLAWVSKHAPWITFLRR